MSYDGPSSGAPQGTPPPQPEYPQSPPGGWQTPVSGGTGYIPQAAEPPPASGNRFKDLWLHPAIVTGVLGTLVILIVAVTVLAVRSFQAPATVADTGDDTTTESTQEGDDTTGETEDSDATGSGNGSSESPADDAPAQEDPVFISGVLEGYPDSAFDFDGGDDYISYDDDEQTFDALLTTDGLEGMNQVQFGEWVEPSAPTTVSQCEGVSTTSGTVHLSRLEQYRIFCFTTAEGRTGYFSVDTVELEDNGTLNDLAVSYTVWKGDDDL
ncbi:hypothetical protein LX16_3524 [Stackebrandtia albiflava]|uniref:Uncharacterized protein n=1 Tax=Stackebrandtia albiflava TaxID=406432 RepID=A0A562V4F9_9ACTN|nr:hypothetical protein [Stackebrandtia albiflava]TWJ12760.1 hypothetical protein LX16_3524 [Stackebrandtia albiflava]